MGEPIKAPAKNPCGSCPYRRDVPSGIWSEEEYDKLPQYDLPTGDQPPNVFLCHQQNGRLRSHLLQAEGEPEAHAFFHVVAGRPPGAHASRAPLRASFRVSRVGASTFAMPCVLASAPVENSGTFVVAIAKLDARQKRKASA